MMLFRSFEVSNVVYNFQACFVRTATMHLSPYTTILDFLDIHCKARIGIAGAKTPTKRYKVTFVSLFGLNVSRRSIRSLSQWSIQFARVNTVFRSFSCRVPSRANSFLRSPVATRDPMIRGNEAASGYLSQRSIYTRGRRGVGMV